MNIYPVNQRTRRQIRGGTEKLGNLSQFAILVIDPDRIHQRILSLQLTKLGIKLEFTANRKVASEMILVKNYNLILVDITFFVNEEANIIGTIRSVKAYEKVPVVGMTALLTEDAGRNAVQAGICEIKERPFSPELLLRHYLWL